MTIKAAIPIKCDNDKKEEPETEKEKYFKKIIAEQRDKLSHNNNLIRSIKANNDVLRLRIDTLTDENQILKCENVRLKLLLKKYGVRNTL